MHTDFYKEFGFDIANQAIHLACKAYPKPIIVNGNYVIGNKVTDIDLDDRIGLYAQLLRTEEKIISRLTRRSYQAKRIAYAENSDLCYITLCHCINCYGGSEEGGWYYTQSIPIAYVAFIPTTSQKRIAKIKQRLVKNHLTGEYSDLQSYRGSGCGGSGDDDGMCIGQSFDEGYGFEYTVGLPYEQQPRPRYE